MSNSFLDPKANDSFSKLRGIDLQELLMFIDSYLLEYRDSLGFPDKLTFGCEFEYDDLEKEFVDNFIMRNFITPNKEGTDCWISKSDASVPLGGEINTPVLRDKKESWQDIKKILEFLKRSEATMHGTASCHMHFGADFLGEDAEAWRLFVKMYILYEPVLFRFFYGEMVNGRVELLNHAYPASSYLFKCLERLNKAKQSYQLRYSFGNTSRYIALNLLNVDFYSPEIPSFKNTVENRTPNATTNHIIIQNNVNAMGKLLMTAVDKAVDEEFLDWKTEHEFYPYPENKALYNEIALRLALEFVDANFDNNFDKIYFLRQYLKGFEDNNFTISPIKAKRFTR